MASINITADGYEVADQTFGDLDAAVAYQRVLAAKMAPPVAPHHAAALAAATDASLDHAVALMKGVSTADWPPAAKRMWQCVMSAGTTVDELLKAMGIPDDDADDPK